MSYTAYVRAHRERRGEYRGNRPHRSGDGGMQLVAIDTATLRAKLARDGRSLNAIERDAGLSQSAIRMVLRRGRCTVATFDAICSTLGLHGYEVQR